MRNVTVKLWRHCIFQGILSERHVLVILRDLRANVSESLISLHKTLMSDRHFPHRTIFGVHFVKPGYANEHRNNKGVYNILSKYKSSL